MSVWMKMPALYHWPTLGREGRDVGCIMFNFLLCAWAKSALFLTAAEPVPALVRLVHAQQTRGLVRLLKNSDPKTFVEPVKMSRMA